MSYYLKKINFQTFLIIFLMLPTSGCQAFWGLVGRAGDVTGQTAAGKMLEEVVDNLSRNEKFEIVQDLQSIPDPTPNPENPLEGSVGRLSYKRTRPRRPKVGLVTLNVPVIRSSVNSRDWLLDKEAVKDVVDIMKSENLEEIASPDTEIQIRGVILSPDDPSKGTYEGSIRRTMDERGHIHIAIMYNPEVELNQNSVFRSWRVSPQYEEAFQEEINSLRNL